MGVGMPLNLFGHMVILIDFMADVEPIFVKIIILP